MRVYEPINNLWPDAYPLEPTQENLARHSKANGEVTMNEEQRKALLNAVKGIVCALGADMEPAEPAGQQYVQGLAFVLAQLVSPSHLRAEGTDGCP